MQERVLPRDFPTNPEFVIPLSNIELQELGTFTAIWAQLDWLILTLFCCLTRVEMGTALLVMEGMTTSPRITLLKKVCHRKPINDVKKAISKLCDDNRGLIEDRNHIIHGLWAIQDDDVTGKPHPACLYEKGGRKPVPAEKLVLLSNRAASGWNLTLDARV